MQITKGKVHSATKLVLYAPEGFGKSTFMSYFPDPVFIDTEGSTKQLDVARFGDMMQDWGEILAAVDHVIANPDCCKTLVIDTADWAEQACIAYTIDKGGDNIHGIEDFGYGKGYVYLQENFKELLDKLEIVISKSINVAFTAHSQMRKFEQPDEMGAYDRYELKLSKKVAPMLKEWADIVLFGNYKTMVYEDSKTKSKKAQGGERVLYTSHHPCWDAKNRHGLPDTIPFKYEAVKSIFEQASTETKNEKKEDVKPDPERKAEEPVAEDPEPEVKEDPKDIPEALKKLMFDNAVQEYEIQAVVAEKGICDVNTPIRDYDPRFIQSALIDQWDKMYKRILDYRKTVEDAVPF